MRPRLAVGCALILGAAAPGIAQDTFEPNPSLARLSADDAYTRTSAESLRTAGIGAAVAIRLDDAGRVLVAGGDEYDAPRIARLDVDGRLDPTFGTAGVAELPVWRWRARLGLEVDAAGRIVAVGRFYEAGTYNPRAPSYTGPWYGAARLLADGSLDSTFSGDGLLEDHGFDGPVRAIGDDGAMLVAAGIGLVRIAADGTVDATYGDGGFAKIPIGFSSFGDLRVADFAVDSAGSAWVPDRRFSGLTGLAISPDGAAAYALGNTFVLRVELTKRKALPLPDLRVKWLGWPHAVDLGGGRYRVSARVRVSNVARHDAATVYGFVGFDDGGYAIPLDPYSTPSTSSRPVRLRARSSVVKRFTWEGGSDTSTNLAGARLSIKVACELPDANTANTADNTATSRTFTPLYAPR